MVESIELPFGTVNASHSQLISGEWVGVRTGDITIEYLSFLTISKTKCNYLSME